MCRRVVGHEHVGVFNVLEDLGQPVHVDISLVGPHFLDHMWQCMLTLLEYAYGQRTSFDHAE